MARPLLTTCVAPGIRKRCSSSPSRERRSTVPPGRATQIEPSPTATPPVLPASLPSNGGSLIRRAAVTPEPSRYSVDEPLSVTQVAPSPTAMPPGTGR